MQSVGSNQKFLRGLKVGFSRAGLEACRVEKRLGLDFLRKYLIDLLPKLHNSVF
jgi:hypothetical protein